MRQGTTLELAPAPSDPDAQRLRYFHMALGGLATLLRAHARGIASWSDDWPEDAKIVLVQFDKDLLCIRVRSKTFDIVEGGKEIPHWEPRFKVITPGGRKIVRGGKKKRE